MIWMKRRKALLFLSLGNPSIMVPWTCWLKSGNPKVLSDGIRSAAVCFDTRIIDMQSQGMGAQIIKAVLSQALLFMSKDQFEHYALVILTLWRRTIQGST